MSGRDGDRVRAHRPVGVHVVDGRRDGLASSERIDDGPAERGVVVGVLVEGLGSTAPGDALSLRPVEAVDRDAQHVARAVHRADHLGELVGEHGLAGAVEAVDGHGDPLTRPERDDAVREVAQDGIPDRRASPRELGRGTSPAPLVEVTGVRTSADGDAGGPGRLVVDRLAHLLGEAHGLLDERLDDLRLGHGLDDLALDEDLALAVAGGDAEVGLAGLARDR